MELNQLIGLSLESVTFSKLSYSFEICGRKSDDYVSYSVGTAYNLAQNEGEEDVYAAVSSFIWPFLECKIENVCEVSSGCAIKFSFEGGLSFIVWGNAPLEDNLLIVTDKQTGAWYPIG